MQLQTLIPLLIPLLTLHLPFSHTHNITKLLSSHPDFATFNHYLSQTHLDDDINSRTTITVCAVDNVAMSQLISKTPSIYTIKNLLSFHVLLDYFGAKKLHQITNGTALVATLFQTTGNAPGSSGFVNVTDVAGGKVAFGPQDNNGTLDVFFVKSLQELPYNISIIQVSGIFPSDVAVAPTPAPSQMNLTDIMSAHGCKIFADTLLATPEAANTYEDTIVGGLTVFCPMDDPFKAFLPRYNNLTSSEKVSFLEFFGVPIYQSLSLLKSNNGVMNTLATDGANKFDFTVQNDGQDVTLKTTSVTAKITGTIIDEQPLAIYTIDKVLLPKELFKDAASPTPAPAPAPSKAAAAPKSHNKTAPASTAASPADSPNGNVADQTADQNGGVKCDGGIRFVVMVLSLCFGLLMVL